MATTAGTSAVNEVGPDAPLVRRPPVLRTRPRPMPSPGFVWTCRVALALICFTVYATASVTNRGGDSTLVLPVAESIVHSHNLDVDEFHSSNIATHYGNVVVNGHHHNYFPWVVALFAVPTVLLVDGLHAVVGSPSMELRTGMGSTDRIELATASMVVALNVLLVVALAWDRLGSVARRRRHWASIAVGTVFALGTGAFSVASRALWQHGPSMLLLTAALYGVSRASTGAKRTRARWLAAAGITAAASYTIRPTNVVVAGVLGLLVLYNFRAQVLWFVIGVVGLMIPWLVVNQLSYGTPMPPYFAGNRLSIHAAYLEAVAGNLVSPARGLLIFSPIVILAPFGVVRAWRHPVVRDHLEAACVVATALYLTAVSGLEERWWAGYSYGPRFMTDTIPLLLVATLPAAAWLADAGWSRWPSRLAWSGTALLVLWSVVAHAQGAELVATTCWNGEPVNVDPHPERIWDWKDAQVTRGIRVARETGITNARSGQCPPFAT